MRRGKKERKGGGRRKQDRNNKGMDMEKGIEFNRLTGKENEKVEGAGEGAGEDKADKEKRDMTSELRGWGADGGGGVSEDEGQKTIKMWRRYG